MDERTRLLMFSKESDEYETPLWLFNRLDEAFNFTLDPAASALSHMCDNYLTIEDNGLEHSWENETVFINPPYSNIKGWTDEAASKFLNDGIEVVMLIPARTETIYFHNNIWPVAHYILFLKGRLKFWNKTLPSYKDGGKPSSAPFPSVVVMYTHKEFFGWDFDDLGYLVNCWEK